MADKNKIDDLDFSDLDLDGDTDGGFDEDFSSEDTGPAALDMDARRPVKKKPDVFTLAVYGVVGLGIIGAVVWQLGLFGPKSSEPYTAPDMAGQVVIPGTEAAGDVGVIAAPSDPFNVMGTPDQVTGANGQPVDAATIDAMTPGDSAAIPLPIEETPVTGVMNAADNSPVQNIPVQGMQAGDTIPMPAQVPADVTSQSLPVIAQPEPVIPAEPVAAATPVKIDAPAPVVPGVSNNDMKIVLDRLDAIEQRLNEKEASSTSATQAELKELKATIAELKSGKIASASPSSDEEAAPVAKKAPAKKKTAAKKRKATSSSSNKTSETSEWDQPYSASGTSGGSSSSSAYTLRAAQPDAAWVGGTDGSLKQVRVGDALPGMGTVTAINQSGGQWTVSTTSGKITQ